MIEVVSSLGRLLTPCSDRKAQQLLDVKLAKWIKESEVIQVTFDPRLYPDVRRAVLRRDNYTCVWCGSVAKTFDHIILASRGGPVETFNGVASCSNCNREERGTKDARFFLKLKRDVVPDPLYVERRIEVAHVVYRRYELQRNHFINSSDLTFQFVRMDEFERKQSLEPNRP